MAWGSGLLTPLIPLPCTVSCALSGPVLSEALQHAGPGTLAARVCQDLQMLGLMAEAHDTGLALADWKRLVHRSVVRWDAAQPRRPGPEAEHDHLPHE